MKHVSLVAILFFSFISWSQNIELGSQNLTVGKYEKLELRFKISEAITFKIDNFINNRKQFSLNPYDPDQINFEAVFISPKGSQELRYGFYYQPFKEEMNFDSWEKDTTSFPWLVRFAPTEIGEWKVQIKVHVVNSTEVIETTTSFTCIDSKHKGYLTTTTSGTNNDRYLSYAESGETFFAIGNNVSSGGFFSYKPSQNRRQMNGVQQLIDVGGNFTRFDMQPQAALPDWPHHNNYTGKQDEMFGFDRLVELCEKNGVYFIVFRHHVELMDSYNNPNGSDWSGVSWFDNPYRIGLELSKKSEYLTDEEAIKWQLKSLRYVFSRWGYSPNFSFYGYSEINNWYSGIIVEEKKTNPNYSENEADVLFTNWFLTQKKYIQTDLKACRMLFSNSYSTIPTIENDPNFNGMFKNSDVVSVHMYESTKDANYNWRSFVVNLFWNKQKKPVVIEEMGIPDNKLKIYCCSGIEYHNNIWSTSLMGSFGTGLDWWWDRGVQDFGYHKNLKPIHTFFKGEELIKMNYEPKKSSDSDKSQDRLIENFYLLSENQERALGWVHNATFYWRNLYDEYPCIKELVDKGQLQFGCYVGEGHDLNSETKGDYESVKYNDDFTLKGGAVEISNAVTIHKNPTFNIDGLNYNFGFKNNYYKIEFYRTSEKDLILDESLTQILSTNIFKEINPHVPNLDKVNPDYAYKVTYLGRFVSKPKL